MRALYSTAQYLNRALWHVQYSFLANAHNTTVHGNLQVLDAKWDRMCVEDTLMW